MQQLCSFCVELFRDLLHRYIVLVFEVIMISGVVSIVLYTCDMFFSVKFSKISIHSHAPLSPSSAKIHHPAIYYRPRTKLRKDNVLTPVSHSVHGVYTPLGRHPSGTHSPGQTLPRQTTTPGWHPPTDTCHQTTPRRPLQRTVCIPLECILVIIKKLTKN